MLEELELHEVSSELPEMANGELRIIKIKK